MKKIFNYLAVTSCLMLSTSLAHADSDSDLSQHPNREDKMFEAMDVNSDGKVTREEFLNYDFGGSQNSRYKRMSEGARSSDGSRQWSDSSSGRSSVRRGDSLAEDGQYLGSGASGGEAGGGDSTDGPRAVSEARRSRAGSAGSSGGSRSSRSSSGSSSSDESGSSNSSSSAWPGSAGQ
jgi:hypothetical protein